MSSFKEVLEKFLIYYYKDHNVHSYAEKKQFKIVMFYTNLIVETVDNDGGRWMVGGGWWAVDGGR